MNRERTMLYFRQRSLEVLACKVAAVGGGGMFLYGIGGITFPALFSPSVAIFCMTFGFLFFASAAWAWALFRELRFDLRKRTYWERYNDGGRIRIRQGPMSEIAHLEIGGYAGIGKPASLSSAPLIYVVRLRWREPQRYPPVLEHLDATSNYAAADLQTGQFYARANEYARLLGVPLYQVGAAAPSTSHRLPF